MAKYVCTVCGWSTEADVQPEKCPLCGATTFTVVDSANKVYACEHKVGDGKVEDKEITKDYLGRIYQDYMVTEHKKLYYKGNIWKIL